MDEFRSLPPVARTLTALTFIQSALVLSGSVSSFWVPFYPQLIFTWRIWPQIWRFVTPFLMTDPKLNFVFDLYFMYTYSSRLEFGSPRFSTPGSFLVYVVFIGSVIMATAGSYLGAVIFTQALILAFAYTYSQDNKGTKTMFFVVEIPTPMLPWARLALTFVMKGYHSAAVEFTGIVAAHLYDFLTRIYPTFGGGKNYIITPVFLRRLFTRSLRGGQERVYGRAFRPPNEQEESSGWASSVRNTWDSRGSGRRLGGT
ncbi:Der1-like family-domain-containing protein [Aspergillus germanicus]